MQNIRRILIVAACLLSATLTRATTTSANGDVTASASMSAATLPVGGSIVFFRAGSSNKGAPPVTWTEATLWYAQGGYFVLGNQYAPNIFASNTITWASLPAAAVGVSSIQLRVVLQDYEYVDDWTTFNVLGIGGGKGGS